MRHSHYPSSPSKADPVKDQFVDHVAASVIAQIKREARGSEFEYATCLLEDLNQHRVMLQEALTILPYLSEAILQHCQKKLALIEQRIHIVEAYRRHL